VETSTVSENRADGSGGGISVSSDSHFQLANSTVAANRAASGGGVVADANAALEIYAATIARNRSKNITLGAGGLEVNNGAYVTVGGSILAANLGYFVVPDPLTSDCSGEPVASFGYNLLSTDSCAGFNQESDVVARNPRLGKLGRHGGPTETIPLLPHSPALDAALDPEAKRAAGPFRMPKRDQRHRRRHDRIPDIGAFELNPGD
jgi:hypothetical protein